MKITELKWQWVEDLKVYRIVYTLNNCYKHTTFIQQRDMLDMPMDAVLEQLMNVKVECEPEEESWR